MKKNSEIPAAERAEIFHEQYGNDLDAGWTLAEIVSCAGDYLACIVGEDAAGAAISRLLEASGVSGGRATDPKIWRQTLEENRCNCFSKWPLGVQLFHLAAYALYGIALPPDHDHSIARYLEELVENASRFLAATPEPWLAACVGDKDSNDLARLVKLATNRWALDNGRPIEPAALAAFGGVSEGRIRNMMSGANRTLANEDGRVPAQEALAWLSGRPEFWNSIWREQRLPRYAVNDSLPLERAVFIPVARDDSAFHPGLRRGAAYTIGEKGAERKIADFDEALAELQRMRTPYWRRPNARGNWGIVAGVRWQRVDASDLDILASDPTRKVIDTDRT